MNNLMLDIDELSKMSIENIISLYQQGYKINENKASIKNLAAVCSGVTTLQQNVSRTLYVTPTGGTPPYTNVSILRDGIVVATAPGTYQSGPIPIIYNFPILGSAVYKSSVTDSCPQTATDPDGCPINVTAGAPPTGTACPGCDTITHYCIAGECLPKSLVLYGGIGFFALMMLRK